jgi:hypothetical protein
MDYSSVETFYLTMLFLEQEKYENLIIDLRNNGGGELYITGEILNMLIGDKDKILMSLRNKDGEIDSLVSTGGGFKFNKIAVLMNENTASAAEIFALSLKELENALLIGGKTVGKGIGQSQFEMSNGDVALMTSFDIITGKGTEYNGAGLTPDISVSPVYTDVKNNKFEQLNFVNCASIKKGAENKAVLGLNQRLARIGYLSPDDVSNKCTDKTVTAVEILQKYCGLPEGISKIDYRLLDYLDYLISSTPETFEETDVVLECAKEYTLKDKKAAADYAAKANPKTQTEQTK